ncbi:hypothetical protein PsAD14_04740 [Pseudovibrio sp. Ad14]|nr:hypothetical protein PsW74_03570 [Pseudovibrio sp. W74]KZL05299.1 hypothetical protein PsAD14_04740 [Pseudovibrio sp. Ad14]
MFAIQVSENCNPSPIVDSFIGDFDTMFKQYFLHLVQTQQEAAIELGNVSNDLDGEEEVLVTDWS